MIYYICALVMGIGLKMNENASSAGGSKAPPPFGVSTITYIGTMIQGV